MARVRIQPGGKVLIAIVVVGALLFLFFEFIPAKKNVATAPPAGKQMASQPVLPQKIKPETAPAKSQPQSKPEATPSVRASAGEGAGSPIRIYFAFNKAHINKNVYCIFDRIQNLVRRDGPGAIHIVVEGNADSIGAPWYNVELSRRRAARVADSLARRLGIPVSRISLAANGSTKPIASNRTRAGRADNRRTDIIISR